MGDFILDHLLPSALKVLDQRCCKQLNMWCIESGMALLWVHDGADVVAGLFSPPISTLHGWLQSN